MTHGRQIESRLLGAVLAFELAKGMVTSGLWMLQPESMMGRIASLSSSPEVFAYLWMTLAILVIPYMVLQITGLLQRHQWPIVRLACWAILSSGVLWVYLAFLSRDLDYANITEIFLFHGATCITTAALLACSLNTSQRHKEL